MFFIYYCYFVDCYSNLTSQLAMIRLAAYRRSNEISGSLPL